MYITILGNVGGNLISLVNGYLKPKGILPAISIKPYLHYVSL